jgi:hypothetical protein
MRGVKKKRKYANCNHFYLFCSTCCFKHNKITKLMHAYLSEEERFDGFGVGLE